MSAIQTAYYRSFQAVFNIGARLLPWRRPIGMVSIPGQPFSDLCASQSGSMHFSAMGAFWP